MQSDLFHCKVTLQVSGVTAPIIRSRARLKCDGTRAETRFGLSGKRTNPFKWAGESVHLTTGSRGVRISGSNAGYTMFWGRVKDYRLPTPLVCFPSTSPPVRHRVPSGFNWAILRTVTAASGTGHNIGTATSLQSGQIGTDIMTCNGGCGYSF